jgi:hypothetical protein
MSEVVKIGPKFFANELRVYRDFAQAFWRENIQNSYDAGASQINITISEGSIPETKLVVIDDNGCGMTEETLRSVYFTLGETTNSGASVGGFGKARILTCFAQHKYSLRTNNLYVTGQGSEYHIEHMESSIRGVKLTIEVYHKDVDLNKSLDEYLGHCHLQDCQIKINGSRYVNWTYRNKHERSLSFGEVYTNKSKRSGILVRVNGVHMFKPYLAAPFLVIIEINQNCSREVLQANRDGLLGKYQDELESFINEININKQSAFRKRHNKSIVYNGTGTFVAKRQSKEFPHIVEATSDDEGFVNPDSSYNPHAVAAPKQHESGFTTEEVTRQINLIFSSTVIDETSNPKIRKVIESYYPHNWDLLGTTGTRYDRRYGEYKSFRAGVDKYKLLVLWKGACEYAINIMQNILSEGPDSISWGIGWYFSDEASAGHRYSGGDGVHWLILNPCKANGNMALSLSSKVSLASMVNYACHEVAHILYDDHDERFANFLGRMLEKAFLNKSEMLNHMKKCKEEAEKRLNIAVESAA